MACAADHRDVQPDDTEGDSLYRFVDTMGVRCMNESEAGSCRNCIRPFASKQDAEPFLESNEDDPELILFIPFTEVVKIKSFALVGGAGGASPSHVKLFVNRDDVDFSSAADMLAAQDVELLEELEAQYAADYPLKQHKFNGVESVTLFVADSFGGDSSRISFLGFKGSCTGINYRDQVEIVYEARAHLKDHKTPAAEQGASNNFLS
jgi:hypothetical protein